MAGGPGQVPAMICRVVLVVALLAGVQRAAIVNAQPPMFGRVAESHYARSENQSRPQAADSHGCGLAPWYRRGGRYKSRSDNDSEPYIDRGELTTFAQFPSYVMVELTTFEGEHKQDYICGGTLISDRHVLTASHCLDKLPGEQIRIQAWYGGRLKKSDYWLMTGVFVKRHCQGAPAGWDLEHGEHDWGVLTLRKPVEFSDYAQPACLPSRSARIITSGPKSECYMVGQGATSAKRTGDNQDYHYTFPEGRMLTLRVEQRKCDTDYWPPIGPNDTSRSCYVAARPVPGGPCRGDSGGPVLCKDQRGRWTVMGITSEANRNCFYRRGEMGTFTDTIKMQFNPRFEKCLEGASLPRADDAISPRNAGRPAVRRHYFA